MKGSQFCPIKPLRSSLSVYQGRFFGERLTGKTCKKSRCYIFNIEYHAFLLQFGPVVNIAEPQTSSFVEHVLDLQPNVPAVFTCLFSAHILNDSRGKYGCPEK